MTYDYCILSDSVEEGEKIVNAALDKFGRIGENIQYSSIYVTNLFAKSDIFFGEIITYANLHVSFVLIETAV